MKKALFLLSFLFIISVFPSVKAGGRPVIINEIMWMGSSISTADEYLELKNTTSFDVDISGWQIEGAGSSGGSIIIPGGSIIPSRGFFVAANYSALNVKSSLLNEPDYVTTSVSLKNSSLKLTLKDNIGNIIDEADTGVGNPLAGNNDNKWSMERRADFNDGTESVDWYTATSQKGIKAGCLDLGTPGFENSKDFSRDILSIKDSKIALREVSIEGVVVVSKDTLFDNRIYVLDSKSGVRVYIERSNWPDLKIGDKVKLRGSIQTYYGETELKVIDVSDVILLSETKKVEPFLVKTGDYKNYEGTLVKIIGKITQTSGDTFYIDDGSGEIKIYVKDNLGIILPKKHIGDVGEIIGIINNWSGSFRLLPRQQSDIKINSPSKIEDIKVLPIFYAKQQPIGTKVETYGRVSVEPGKLGKTIFYIQDDSSGIQIYSWYKDFPFLILGDWIEVMGEISETGGEKRIKIKLASDIRVLESGKAPIPHKVNIKQSNNYLGRLVTIKGTITKSSGNTFYINDGSGIIKIYIKDETGIKKPRTKKGDVVEISGIASTTDSGLRILPRYQADFKLVWSKPPKAKVLKASTYKRPELNKEETILEATKVPVQNNLLYITLGSLLLIGSSIILLKNVKLSR